MAAAFIALIWFARCCRASSRSPPSEDEEDEELEAPAAARGAGPRLRARPACRRLAAAGEAAEADGEQQEGRSAWLGARWARALRKASALEATTAAAVIGDKAGAPSRVWGLETSRETRWPPVGPPRTLTAKPKLRLRSEESSGARPGRLRQLFAFAMARSWLGLAALLLCAAFARADIQEEVLDHDDRSIILIAR